MTSPFRTESLTRPAAAARLRQLGAVHRPEYALPGQQLYWSGSANVWIVAAAQGSGIRLEFHRGCPCNQP